MALPSDTYLKPDFPKVDRNDNGTTTTLEYVGPASAFTGVNDSLVGSSASPYAGVVKSARKDPLENTDYFTVEIVCEKLFDGAATPGTAQEVSYEIDWTLVERSLYEHPAFRAGGEHALGSADISDIEFWRIEKREDLKSAYKYWKVGDTEAASYEQELSPAAKLFAKGIQLGTETWPDYVPVARKVSSYVNGPPPASIAGAKNTPTGFPNLPTGYEWRKSADRSTRAGGQRKWERTEEWEGADLVLVDKTAIYYTL